MSGTDGRIVVVGAGMAGARCARLLADAGADVTVLDKGRSVGGRLAQRRAEAAVFDHGAQYMTARDPGFAAQLERWEALGAAAPWAVAAARIRHVPRSAEPASAEPPRARWVGVPSMSAPVRAMLDGITVRTGTTVGAIARDGAGWTLRDADGSPLGTWPQLVLAIPSPQAATLLGASDPLAQRLQQAVGFAPCLSAMVAFATRAAPDLDVVDDRAADLAWAARNPSKPGRPDTLDCWTLHGGPGFSRAHLEAPPGEWSRELLARFAAVAGPLPEPVRIDGHRWRYSLVERALGEDCVWQAERGLGLCGDWCIAGWVEAAWRSGDALGRAMTGAG